MRKRNAQILKEIIQECLKDLRIDRKLKEIQLIHQWEEVIGKTIARSTDNIYIKNKTLFIHVNSSVIRNELFMLKEELIKALNDKVGERLIDKIVLR